MLVVTCFLNIIQAQTFYFDIHRYTDGNETVALWHAFRGACQFHSSIGLMIYIGT